MDSFAGDGGAAGSATGGTIELTARTGGSISASDVDLAVNGTGGTGGTAGLIGEFRFGTAGTGGDGGDGTGGTATVIAQGGTVTLDATNITAQGNAGAGGSGSVEGGAGNGFVGPSGLTGFGNGGTAIVEVQEGSPGIINFGPTTIEVSGAGGTGGRIEITDTSVSPTGLITFDTLTATALGLNNPAFTGFFMTSNSGAITVNGSATVNVAGDNWI